MERLAVGLPRTAPRLGFLGVGWIGLQRMQSLARSGAGRVAAIADPSAESRLAAARGLGDVLLAESLDGLLAHDLDGVVIATPSALHAEQAIAALERGLAVFCQKPLARTSAEARRVIDAARAADRLLGVDYSYRHTTAVREAKAQIGTGRIGQIFAAELVFHNAYGPDKPWFRNADLSGGGCLMDLGTHLIDLVLWILDGARVAAVDARLFTEGRRWRAGEVEDFADVRLELGDGAHVRIGCSWNLPAGQDAVISFTFYGSEGGVAVRNVNGSFFDFIAERLEGTTRSVLALPPDDWGGRAVRAWATRLGRDRGYDPDIEHTLVVADTLDAIYGRA
jgi:predicted dehydrogenase